VQSEDKALLDANVRKVVGISALRRLRRLVSEYEEDERRQKAFAIYMAIAVGFGTVLLTLFCLISPQSVIGMLRSLVVFVR
jgi:hypothetical protein